MKSTPVTNFLWEHKCLFLASTTIGIPLAIESISFLKSVYHDPSLIKKKLQSFKKSVHETFHQKADESLLDFKKRSRRNIIISIVASIVLLGAVSGPLVLISSASLAIPAALLAANAVGKGFYQLQQQPNMIHRARDYVKDAFAQRVDETSEEFQHRKRAAIKALSNMEQSLSSQQQASAWLHISSQRLPVRSRYGR